MDGVLGEIAGLVMETAVEVRLAATGLRRGKIDGDAEASQQLHRGDADVGKQGVAQAGDHQRDVHGIGPQYPWRGGAATKSRNPKVEIRNKSEIRMSQTHSLVSCFGLRICFGFRFSCFEFLRTSGLRLDARHGYSKRWLSFSSPSARKRIVGSAILLK